MPMTYFNPFDYIAVLSELKDKLTEQEIEDVNNFYENVKKIDNKKMYFFHIRDFYNNYPISNNPAINPYEQQYIEVANHQKEKKKLVVGIFLS